MPKIPLRLSYSTMDLVHSCARKYQLIKLVDTEPQEKEGIIILENNTNNKDLDFGHAFGVGAQHLAVHGDIDKAIVAALMDYNFVEHEVKCMESLILAIEATQGSLTDWKVLDITNQHGITKPAEEVSFKIELGDGDYYCGYIDLILQHLKSKQIITTDYKTTQLNRLDLKPMYSNSDQVLGYSCVLDNLFHEMMSLNILYIIAQFKGSIIPIMHYLPFTKTPQDKLEWLIKLQIDYRTLKQYQDIGFYPKRGDACTKWNKLCNFYGLCDMHKLQEQLFTQPKEEEQWDFTFHIDELIENTMAQVAIYEPTEEVPIQTNQVEEILL